MNHDALGRRPEHRDVGLAVAVVVALHGQVTDDAKCRADACRRGTLQHEPRGRARAEDRRVRAVIAVEIAERPRYGRCGYRDT